MKIDIVRPAGYDALPARFKTYIRAMESRLATLEAQVPDRASKQGARLRIVDRLHGGNDGYLPDDTQFEFTIGGDEYRVQAARDGMDGLEVSTPRGSCVVHPRVSNVVVIGRDKR